MKKFISLALALGIMGSLLVGCGGGDGGATETTTEATADGGETTAPDGGGDDQNQKELQVGVCIYKYDDTYISSVRSALETLGQENAGKIKLNMNDGKGDQGVQNDQIDTMIEKGMDVLLINLVDVGAAPTVIEKVKKADIPVIFFNREPDTETLKSYDKARFIGTNAKDAGIIQGEIIAETWANTDLKVDKNGDGVLQYVMFQGEPDNPEAVARTKYSVDTVKEKGIDVEELGLQVCNWQVDLAQNAMEAWFSNFGEKIEFIIANNDDMARGAIQAIQAQGYNMDDPAKFIPVVGVDATVPAQDLISKGYMTGSVLQDGPAMAKALYEATLNVGNGKDAVEGTEYQYDDTGIAIRIPYQKFTKTN